MKTIRKRRSWKFNPKGINIWDNFFTDECLDILRHRVLYAKHFDKKYDDYYAIDYFKNQDYLSDLIAKELSSKIDLPKFQRAWSFVYDKHEGKGVGLHCDPSIINLNVWVSTDKAIKDKSKNGLTIYEVKPPPTWTRSEWNDNPQKALKYVKSKKVKPKQVPYKSNRAIFFDGAYFHASSGISTKKGFENQRVSYTMLFGEQLEYYNFVYINETK
jgi:hypothetical protein